MSEWRDVWGKGCGVYSMLCMCVCVCLCVSSGDIELVEDRAASLYVYEGYY